MAEAYIRWMKKHPEALPKHRRVVLEDALSEELCPRWKEFEKP